MLAELLAGQRLAQLGRHGGARLAEPFVADLEVARPPGDGHDVAGHLVGQGDENLGAEFDSHLT